MMIKLNKVEKYFSDTLVIDELSLNIEKPGIYGLLGPNGAGKTTTIRLICGITEPDRGSIEFDKSVFNSKGTKLIGYMPEAIGLYSDMTILSHIYYLAELHGINKPEIYSRLKELISAFQLQPFLKKRINQLSKGTIQKVQFICSTIHNPKILILDEPFSGLDPISSLYLEKEIVKLKDSGVVIILSTHRMEQAEEFCNHIFIINNGRKIADSDVTSLKEDFRENLYEVILYEKLPIEFKNLIVSEETNTSNYKYVLKIKDDAKLDELLIILVQNKIPISRIVELFPSVKEIFKKLVTSKRD